MRERDDLPLPDYNQLQVGSLTSRIRTLGAEDLQTLIDYERSHAKRVQVMAAMENRLTSLKAGGINRLELSSLGLRSSGNTAAIFARTLAAARDSSMFSRTASSRCCGTARISPPSRRPAR